MDQQNPYQASVLDQDITDNIFQELPNTLTFFPPDKTKTIVAIDEFNVERLHFRRPARPFTALLGIAIAPVTFGVVLASMVLIGIAIDQVIKIPDFSEMPVGPVPIVIGTLFALIGFGIPVYAGFLLMDLVHPVFCFSTFTPTIAKTKLAEVTARYANTWGRFVVTDESGHILAWIARSRKGLRITQNVDGLQNALQLASNGNITYPEGKRDDDLTQPPLIALTMERDKIQLQMSPTASSDQKLILTSVVALIMTHHQSATSFGKWQ